jgi:hypothetical protein
MAARALPIPSQGAPCDDGLNEPGLGSPAFHLRSPTRSRRRTTSDAGEDEHNNDRDRKRSSLISATAEPVPAIPKRFLRPSPRLHDRNGASQTYNHQAYSKGELASSPLAYHHSSSTTPDSSRSPPLRAFPSTRRSLLPISANRNAAPGVTNFSTRGPLKPTAPRRTNASYLNHARSASANDSASALPKAEFTFRFAPVRKPDTDEATLAALTGQDVAMEDTHPEGGEDLFMQLAEDSNDGEPTLTQFDTDRAASRSSWHGKRQQQRSSLPTPTENGRPRTSGQLNTRPSSRFSARIDTSRANSGYKPTGAGSISHFTSPRYDPTTPSSAHLRRTTQLSNQPDYSPRSSTRYYDRTRSPEKSPELPTFGRRRPSFGHLSTAYHDQRRGSQPAKTQDSEGDSPENSSEAKRSAAESDSVDSQTAPSTVWDELDDLKSRIKKLELTGKIPPTSSAALMSGASGSDRPRTATTAPTTIDSSPKQQRKSDPDVRTGTQDTKSSGTGALTLADLHPTLHAALAKAKALLSASLYRTLEATANDALQLVAMTGSAGPQGTNFSAASIINGVTVSDRHIRRKADMMCRNLTDLCLALCEGKHEAPSIVSSPVAIEAPSRAQVPKPKYSRSSLAYGEDLSKVGNRPMSRLEARKSSIFGLQPGSSALSSPQARQASPEDVSISEYETTPSQPQRLPEVRHQSRLTNRLSAPRLDRYNESIAEDDMRAPSRAMTEIGNFRSPHSQQQSPRDYNTVTNKLPQRSPGLRESLTARRSNAAAFETNREIPRVASMNLEASRRRFTRDSTPQVLEEEETGEQDDQSQYRRRTISIGNQYTSRRAVDVGASRTSSLSHRRSNVSNVMVE